MHPKQKEFLEDTHDILVGYDGCGTVESLKELIDETRERINYALRTDFSLYPEDTDFNALCFEEQSNQE